jgi:Lon protease-like protein
MLPATIPLFPLPGVVVFPGVLLPLHVFEERYRAMVDDALAGQRIIGMAMLRPGFERDYYGRPPVYPVGCAGTITRAQRLDDGRFNIVLQGMMRFRIAGEEDGRAYRLARVEPLPEEGCAPPPSFAAHRQRLLTALAGVLAAVGGAEAATGISDLELVNGLAQGLDLEPLERQALLELPDHFSRCTVLADLLEMKAYAAPGERERGAIH